MSIFGRKAKIQQIDFEEGARKRQQIIDDAHAMQRLQSNEDFQRFCALVKEEQAQIVAFLMDENGGAMKENDARTRLIARSNQIDRVLNIPKSLVWQMENLTEVRDAIKEQQKAAAKNPREAGSR